MLFSLAEVFINTLVERIKLKEFLTFMLRKQESWHEVLNNLALKFFNNVSSDNYRLGFLNYFVVFCVYDVAFNVRHSFHIPDELFQPGCCLYQNSYLLVGGWIDFCIRLFVHQSQDVVCIRKRGVRHHLA